MIIMMNNFNKRIPLFIIIVSILSACSSNNIRERKTLHSLDQKADIENLNLKATRQKRSDEEVRDAYANYLSNASLDDNARQVAINRLAELEFEVSNKLALARKDLTESETEEIEQRQFLQKINRTIDLFSVSLRDYPKAKGNDKIIYQLAKAYDQKGDFEQSAKMLLKLVKEHPKSRYYSEAQFRLAENYFSQAKYTEAEDAYTEVIVSRKNKKFYEKAVFKRGWTRFKQSFFEVAIEDYFNAVTYHDFGNIYQMEQSEKERFEEYFRAIGLTFASLGGVDALHSYFQENPDFEYLYYSYAVMSDIYLKQERFSDAATALNQFIAQYPASNNIPEAELKIINIWQQSRFTEKLYSAIEIFYQNYNPSSRYWKVTNDDSKINKSIRQSLKEYVLLMSEYFHSKYQKDKKNSSYLTAAKWYQRYLKDYRSYARKDNIYFLYAELLAQKKDDANAFTYYELAAYDEGLILDKKSAYATIILSERLFKKNKQANDRVMLDKYIKYSLLFAELYPKDERLINIVLRAAELAFKNKKHAVVIELTNLISEQKDPNVIYNANVLKAQSYFAQNQFVEAENTYSVLISSPKTSNKDRKAMTDRMALSIYNQAVEQQKQNMNQEAGRNFMRISTLAKSSEIASTGLYDAIAVYMKIQSWEQAVAAIKRFQSYYPNHRLKRDVTKKLSIAYLKSDQSIKAAEQFEKIAGFEKNKDLKKVALWQAAELYESEKNYISATRSYTEYANTYKTPYPQYIEAMVKLVELYDKSNKPKLLEVWRKRIVNADKKTKNQDKTERTKYIASSTTLSLAREKNKAFDRYRLVEPLKANLKKKKKAMQEAIKLYGKASSFGISETATESTFAIAQIYQDFSTALLDSERPKKLKGEQLEQYNILLEDQAYPFEDKAIEFNEINLSRIKGGIYDDWISKSLTTLKKLFPVKYDRKSKIDGYIDVTQ